MLVCDTHVHIYPGYDLELFFQSAFSNFNSILPNADRILFLTERFDCNFFQQLCEGNFTSSKLSFERSPDAAWLRVAASVNEKLWLVAGHQIVTIEKLEVLALSCMKKPKEGGRASETINSILSEGGIPVMPYSPGKWTFARAKMLSELLRDFGTKLYLSDSSLRARAIPRPSFFHGRTVLAGSDPLPLRGEESRVAQYVSVLDGALQHEHPYQSFKNQLESSSNINSAGKRLSLPAAALLQMRLRIGK